MCGRGFTVSDFENAGCCSVHVVIDYVLLLVQHRILPCNESCSVQKRVE